MQSACAACLALAGIRCGSPTDICYTDNEFVFFKPGSLLKEHFDVEGKKLPDLVMFSEDRGGSSADPAVGVCVCVPVCLGDSGVSVCLSW